MPFKAQLEQIQTVGLQDRKGLEKTLLQEICVKGGYLGEITHNPITRGRKAKQPPRVLLSSGDKTDITFSEVKPLTLSMLNSQSTLPPFTDLPLKKQKTIIIQQSDYRECSLQIESADLSFRKIRSMYTGPEEGISEL